jgi:hypothetical protein
MAMKKKSLVGNRSTAKKAMTPSGPASSRPAASRPVAERPVLERPMPQPTKRAG